MTQNNPSIEDLLKKPDAPQPNQPAAPSADEDAQVELLHKMGQIEHTGVEREVEQRAQKIGLGYIDFADAPLDREALPLLSKEEMQQLSAVVFLNREGMAESVTI